MEFAGCFVAPVEKITPGRVILAKILAGVQHRVLTVEITSLGGSWELTEVNKAILEPHIYSCCLLQDTTNSKPKMMQELR